MHFSAVSGDDAPLAATTAGIIRDDIDNGICIFKGIRSRYERKYFAPVRYIQRGEKKTVTGYFRFFKILN